MTRGAAATAAINGRFLTPNPNGVAPRQTADASRAQTDDAHVDSAPCGELPRLKDL